MSANVLSDHFIKSLNADKLIPLAAKILTSAPEVLDAQDKAKDMVQESWQRFFNKYGNGVCNEQEVVYIMLRITRNTCFEYIRHLKIEHRYLMEHIQKESEESEIGVSLDVASILKHIPTNYKYILEAEQNIQHENQQELVQKISGEYKQQFQKKEFNVNIFRSLKKRAKAMIEKLIKNDAV